MIGSQHKIEFHSGKRLSLARKLKGLMQKQLIDLANFPHVSLKTIGRWETNGIIQSRIEEISRFFHVSPWVFVDPNLQHSQFEQIILNPELQSEYLEGQKNLKEQRPGLNPLREQIQDVESTLIFDELRELICSPSKEGITEKLKAKLDEKRGQLPPNFQTIEGWTLLFWAAYKENVPALEILLEEGLFIEQEDVEGLTPLLVATAKGAHLTVQALLDLGANMNHQDLQGWSALHWAVMSRDQEMVKILLEAKANPDLVDHKGRCPIYRAVSSGNEAIVKSLLEYKANPLLKTSQGISPMLLAEQEKYRGIVHLFAKQQVS